MENGKKRHLRNRKIVISFLSLKSLAKIIERRSELRYGTCRTPQEFVCPDVKVPSGELKIVKQLYTLRPVGITRKHHPHIFECHSE